MKIRILLFLFFSCCAVITSAQTEDKPVNTSGSVREVGIGLANFNNFALQYRWGTEKKLFRVGGTIAGSTTSGNSSKVTTTDNGGFGSTNEDKSDSESPISINAGVNIAALRLWQQSEKFGFLLGPFLGFNYNMNNTTTNGTVTFTNLSNPTNTVAPATYVQSNSLESFIPSFGAALGVWYKISPAVIMYAEISPNIYYNYSISSYRTENTNVSGSSTNSTTRNEDNSSVSYGFSNFGNSSATIMLVYRFRR